MIPHEIHVWTTVRTKYDHETQVRSCQFCHAAESRFWIDGDDDRRGRWSRWHERKHVIHEQPSIYD